MDICLRRVSLLKTTDNAVKMTNKLSLRKQKEFRFVKTSVNLRSFKNNELYIFSFVIPFNLILT